MINRVKVTIGQKKPVLGTFYELGGIMAAKCLGIAGFDFIVIDTEHGVFDVESALTAILASESKGTVPFVRVKDTTRPSILKMLDIGAKGLIVPCIETVEQVEKLVEYAKYYPTGRRGFAPALAGDYGFADFASDTDTYFRVSNEETLLIPQCETMGCLEHIEEIAAMDGVDGIFVGPYDLSVALGKPAQMDNPQLTEAIMRVRDVCRNNGKISMIYAGTAQASKQWFDKGFDCVACGMDSIMLIQAAKNIITEIKGQEA